MMSPQGPSRDIMLNGFFKNRVLAWSKEEGGAAPLLVQASARCAARRLFLLACLQRAACVQTSLWDAHYNLLPRKPPPQ